MEKVLYEIKDRVGYITLNRPEKKNAINEEMTKILWEAAKDIKYNPDVCPLCKKNVEIYYPGSRPGGRK